MASQKFEMFEGQEVLPSPKFASPVINSCFSAKRSIFVSPSGDRIERHCLATSSAVFAIDASIFKESLYGAVHRGWILQFNPDTGEYSQTTEAFQIAVKKYSKQKMSRYFAADDPLQEFSALQHIGNDHINVLGQIDCLEDESYYYSVMRYCGGGELYKRIMSEGPMSEDAARPLFLQLLSGLEYLQSKEIFHRDISLENILLSQDNTTPYFIDFGMCLRQPISPSSGAVALLPSMVAKGKKSYMAPEIVAEGPANGFSADIWSLGIVLFTLLSGKFVVTHASALCPLFRYVRARRLKDMCKQWRLGLSPDAEDLLFRMITAKPSERPTLEEIKGHPWCQRVVGQVQSC
jgi:serine/threonine protein kinase